MSWVKIDYNIAANAKIAGLPDSAFRLYIYSICWSASQLTDGFIPSSILHRLGVKSASTRAQLLVNSGLFEVVTDGYLIHDYLYHQSTKAQVEKAKEANRERVKKHRSNAISNAPVMELEEKRREVDKKRKELSTTNPAYKELANYLAERIQSNGSKKPTVTKAWIDDMRLLVERDGRTPEQVYAAIDWCQQDAFWRSNILSPGKLRAKYDQLRLRASTQHEQAQPKGLATLIAMREEELAMNTQAVGELL
jgi:hypothetical protein